MRDNGSTQAAGMQRLQVVNRPPRAFKRPPIIQTTSQNLCQSMNGTCPPTLDLWWGSTKLTRETKTPRDRETV